jgi:hypothetical protein
MQSNAATRNTGECSCTAAAAVNRECVLDALLQARCCLLLQLSPKDLKAGFDSMHTQTYLECTLGLLCPRQACPHRFPQTRARLARNVATHLECVLGLLCSW